MQPGNVAHRHAERAALAYAERPKPGNAGWQTLVIKILNKIKYLR